MVHITFLYAKKYTSELFIVCPESFRNKILYTVCYFKKSNLKILLWSEGSAYKVDFLSPEGYLPRPILHLRCVGLSPELPLSPRGVGVGTYVSTHTVLPSCPQRTPTLLTTSSQSWRRGCTTQSGSGPCAPSDFISRSPPPALSHPSSLFFL